MTDAYRNKLIVKLRLLIVVINNALEKLKTGQHTVSDTERTNEIISKLENTRNICERALLKLDQYQANSPVILDEDQQIPAPITQSDIDAVDWQELLSQL